MRLAPFAGCRWFRLAAYLQVFDALAAAGETVVTSAWLSQAIGVSPALVRKDMRWLRGTQGANCGRQGVGYSVGKVRDALLHFTRATAPLAVALSGPSEITSWVGNALCKTSPHFYPVSAAGDAKVVVVLGEPASAKPASSAPQQIVLNLLTPLGAEIAPEQVSGATPAPIVVDMNLGLLLLAVLARLAGGDDGGPEGTQ